MTQHNKHISAHAAQLEGLMLCVLNVCHAWHIASLCQAPGSYHNMTRTHTQTSSLSLEVCMPLLEVMHVRIMHAQSRTYTWSR